MFGHHGGEGCVLLVFDFGRSVSMNEEALTGLDISIGSEYTHFSVVIGREVSRTKTTERGVPRSEGQDCRDKS